VVSSIVASVVVALSSLLFAVVPCLTFAPPVVYLRLVQRRAERCGAG
jgi:hypothetical protein